MTVDPDVLVLPAFDDIDGLPGEVTPWQERYDLDVTTGIPGVDEPVCHDGTVAVVPTGIGKVRAATTTAALVAADSIDLSDALVLSVGIAGGPPAVDIGSVVVGDAILDWDDKCRFDDSSSQRRSGETETTGPIEPNPYTAGQGVYKLDGDRVAAIREMATDVPDGPRIHGGTNVCGDELWHGRAIATKVESLVDEFGLGPYRATEMEDAGTAGALERFDMLDRFASIRGISNHDRATGSGTGGAMVETETLAPGVETGLAAAVRVAQRVIEVHRA